ncbi:MAG: N-acetyl-gamma-glutamyl-phosphate reductase [Gammaproteobacteria bacterium]|nr:N-acetyl-gamma-glutamyl-phosphate reductase [Gammaproteobacteria bacterium]
MGFRVFIDGQEGTTGLEIYEHLSGRDDISLVPVDDRFRKDSVYKRERYEEADVVILCLPDLAAREAVELMPGARFLDASTAHRTEQNWVYGLPELATQSRISVSNAQYVSNPGCYPTGFLLAVRPLVDQDIVPDSQRLQVHAVSGYSGGGKKLIALYETQRERLMDTRIYGLNLEHKHRPEMQCHAGLEHAPFFSPAVGPFYRGMVVKFALSKTDAAMVNDAWSSKYEHEPFVRVLPTGGGDILEDGFLSAELCNHTNRVDLLVSSNGEDALVCAVLDNLGKGAASAAVQNLNLMLGIEESTGLRAFA